MGSSCAAFQAGYIPNPIPIIEQTINPIIAQSKGIIAGILKITETIFPALMPNNIPTTPPNWLKKIASNKN